MTNTRGMVSFKCVLYTMHSSLFTQTCSPSVHPPHPSEIKVQKVCPPLNDSTCTEASYWTLKNGNSLFSDVLSKPYSFGHYKRNQCGLEPCNHHHSHAVGIEPVLLPLLLTMRTVKGILFRGEQRYFF